MSFVSLFRKGRWLGKAKWIVSNPKKLSALLNKFSSYISRKGLKEIKEDLLLMRDYLRDVITGKYQHYDTKKLILIVAAIIYIVAPFDILPDLIPGGLIDDVSIAVWAMKEAFDELDRYKRRR